MCDFKKAHGFMLFPPQSMVTIATLETLKADKNTRQHSQDKVSHFPRQNIRHNSVYVSHSM